jgi:uncharacterized protein
VSAGETDEPRLLADAMLGGLARWLRVLGFDVVHEPHLDDAALVALAVAERRLILTRDRKLVERRLARSHLLIASERVPEQLRQVLDALAVEPAAARVLTRCLRCNELLAPLDPEKARPRVPAFVARTQNRYRQCPVCGRVYWAATHAARMRERLAAMGVTLREG